MRSIKKQWRLPKGIKAFIWDNTDFQKSSSVKTSQFVSCIEMYDGMPIKRIFGFKTASRRRNYEDIMVKEVARFYRHKMYLGYVLCNLYSGAKIVDYSAHPDRFDLWNGKWFFDEYSMTKPMEFLEENSLPYTGWNRNCEIEFFEYITRYFENPRIELLAKAGLSYWIQYTRYLDTSKKTLHEIFKIRPECVHLLKEPGFGFTELMTCRRTGYSDMKLILSRVALDSQRNSILREYNQNFYKDDQIIQVLKQDKTVRYCSGRYAWFTHDYIDYLQHLAKIGAISDPKMHYPANFQEAHAKVNKEVEVFESRQLIEGFMKQYEEFLKYSLEEGGYLIRPVKEPKELYAESACLHHCVRTYDKNVAAGTTEIMFIRKKEEPETPFYTLELKKGKVVQVRGAHNSEPKEDIQGFVRKWAKHFKIVYTAQQPQFNMYY